MALADLTVVAATSWAINNAINQKDPADRNNWEWWKENIGTTTPGDPNKEQRKRDEEDCHLECEAELDCMRGEKNKMGQGNQYTKCLKECMAKKGY